MSLGIVIVKCDQEEFFGDCLASCEAQKPDQLVVVDDAKLGLGLAGALKHGVAKLETDFFIPIAADDMLREDFASKTLAAVGDADACYTDIQWFGLVSQVVQAARKFPPPDIRETNNLCGVSLYRKSTYDAVGGYRVEDEWWCDWGLWLSLIDHGATAVHVEEPLFLYRRHGSNVSSTRSPEERERLMRLIRRNHPCP